MENIFAQPNPTSQGDCDLTRIDANHLKLDSKEGYMDSDLGSFITTDRLRTLVLKLENPSYQTFCERTDERNKQKRAADKIVAAARGWLFRQHVLWNPHSSLGAKYLAARARADVNATGD